MRVRLNKLAEDALEATGLPYEIILGTKHYKVKLAGHMVAILPMGGKSRARQGNSNDKRTARDIVAAAEKIKRGERP